MHPSRRHQKGGHIPRAMSWSGGATIGAALGMFCCTLRDGWAAFRHHYAAGNLEWFQMFFMGVTHACALYALFVVVPSGRVMWQTYVEAAVLLFLSGLGVTAGAHRLWSHRSYSAAWPLRLFLMLCQATSFQRSVYSWATNHRVHHKHSDSEADPHNVNRGFFYSHIGWLFVKRNAAYEAALAQLDASDLWDDPIVRFQHVVDSIGSLSFFSQTMCFPVPAFVAHYGWGEDFWVAYFIAGHLRFVMSLHATFCVNSFAHMYGMRPYDAAIPPAENRWVSYVAIGEGWHNYHHKFPYDYATSEFGHTQQFNPTKLFIDMCDWLGLAWDRKRATGACALTKQKKHR